MNTRTKSLISTIAGFAALSFFAMAIIYWAIFTNPAFNLNIGQWDATLRVLMVLAIVAFSVYLIISPESVGASAAKRSTRLTANALVVSLVAIGIGIALNIIVANVATGRADLTAGKDFTLSEQTIKVLQELDSRNKNVTAVAIYSDQSPGGTSRQSMEDLLKEYSSHSSHLKYEFLDPYASPARARELGVQQLGTVVFDDGTKREYANTVTEADFTSALVRILDTSTRTVAFLAGHGERTADGSEGQNYSTVKSALERENYRVITWNTVTSPTITLSDVTVLVIAAPQKALNAKETQAVQSYLDGGGHVLMALDPTMPAEALQPMAQVLQKYGVTPVQGDLIDLASTASAQDPTIVLVRNMVDHEITRPLSVAGEVLVFPLAMGLVPPTSTVGSFVTTSLIQSSPSADQSWLETELSNPAVKYDAGKDLPGPVTIGLTIAPAASTSETETNQVATKLVVFSDADFASNIAVQQVIGNQDLFANSVSWLSGANELVSIRAKDPTTPRTITLDSGQKNFIGITTILALPLFVLLFGAFTWWRRR
jgi:ABC-type uncharacterized transport system involved in gliding motility auxiliary subunit